MNIFDTKEEATEYAIQTYGAVQVETDVACVVKVGRTIAKFLGCKEGWAVGKEIR